MALIVVEGPSGRVTSYHRAIDIQRLGHGPEWSNPSTMAIDYFIN